MHIEKTLPIQVNGGWDEIDVLFNQYYKIEFTEDFGAFKKGEKFDSLSINYGEGQIEAYDEEGKVVRNQNYTSIPKD
jgi:hypothetical protein